MRPEEARFGREVVVAAFFCALGVVVPLLFHAVGLGRFFLPMHLPVLIAGFLLSPSWAVSVGVLTPWVSMAVTGMPPFPITPIMSLELAALAGVAAALTRLRVPWALTLPLAILARCVVTWLITTGLGAYLGLPPQATGWAAVASGGPGILLQLVATPVVLATLQRARPQG